MERGEPLRQPTAALVGCGLVAAIGVVGAIAVAGSHGIAPHGIGFTG
jgi:hypothetical protein